MTQPEIIQCEIPFDAAGRRFDQVLAELVPDYSRARLQQWIKDGHVLINGQVCRPKDKLAGGERVELRVVLEPAQDWQAEAIPLDVIYEDDTLLVINKPAGLVVHPASGNWEGTLLNALLHHAPELQNIPRAGIVHRLDKDTTGLLVVARTLSAQNSLVEQLQARSFLREYEAVAMGVMTAGGHVDAPIGRHHTDRKRQAVTHSGKEALTHYRVVERFRAHTHIRLKLETGRTHQIRVHMAHIRYPLVGDPVYGGRLRIPAGCTPELAECLRGFRRQALHAARLGIEHPSTGEFVEWQAPLPNDMQGLLEVLREDARHVAK